ncbi:MAG: translation elongation factor Ts [Planctomycetota bacterium]|nr:translation elongation factor Ts [Planctomycetota bacterium]
MAAITAAAVKELREITDLPMMECKKALVEANGDQEKAIAILKDAFKKISINRAGNVTTEGRIAILIADGGASAAMVELQCESAPVAANDGFQSLADQCARQMLSGPGAETPEELLQQAAPDAAGKTLNDLYEDLVNKIREKIVLSRVIKVDGPVAGYVHHDGKTGVLFQVTGEDAPASVIRDVAMHIAALKPTVTNVDQLDSALVKAERDRLSEEARATGKPENIIEKIVDGRMNSFYVEQGVLVLQPFAKDDSKSVSQALAEKGLTAAGFTRWVIGG